MRQTTKQTIELIKQILPKIEQRCFDVYLIKRLIEQHTGKYYFQPCLSYALRKMAADQTSDFHCVSRGAGPNPAVYKFNDDIQDKKVI